MSTPIHAQSRSPSPSSTLGRRRPNLINFLPPVFSPENSPPMSTTTFRKQYLPLISPAIIEDDRPSTVGRRGSTPSLQKSSASHYFQDLRKRRRTSESSPVPGPSTPAPVFVLQKDTATGSTIAELPTSIAQPIRQALESQAKSSASSLPSLKKRTMSLPSSSHAPRFTDLGIEQDSSSTNDMPESEKRANVRSQQLALLASQARLARTGTTSVNTAMRAERAVQGAVKMAVEAQAIKEGGRAIKSGDDKEERLVKEGDDSAGGEEKKSGQQSGIKMEDRSRIAASDLQDTTQMWSNALSSPQIASAFLHSASEVAHDWANGFYAFEKEWAGDALQKERRRLSENNEPSRKRIREDVDDDEKIEEESLQVERPPSPKRTASEPSTREVSPSLQSSIVESAAAGPSSARFSLVAAHKRLSQSLPVMTTLKTVKEDGSSSSGNNGGRVGGGEGGKLVDVLSNFVNLIEQRKEGCHGLERLAKNARRLSTVQLPSLSTLTNSAQDIVLEDDIEVEDDE